MDELNEVMAWYRLEAHEAELDRQQRVEEAKQDREKNAQRRALRSKMRR
jgi:hypothetical protein